MSRVERIGDAKTVAIYALCDYPLWTPRYIGKTTQHLHDRHKAHIRAAKRGRSLPVHYWLRKKMENNERLAIWLIEFVRPFEDWVAREKYWIRHYRDLHGNLLNLTDGGEGLSGHKLTEEHASKIAAALRTGRHFYCEKCGAAFYRKGFAIAKGQTKFCSRKCSNARHKSAELFDVS